MKTIFKAFLVLFLANNAIGQTVNPETFPIGVGKPTGKYFYTNTGGNEAKFLADSFCFQKTIDTVSMTYADFYNLITNSQLIGGITYIIVDFQTIYDQMDFDNTGVLKGALTTKYGAKEKIWVLALGSDRIADKAYSETYPKDEIQYDWTYSQTPNGSPAKGRISERIDEWNNRTDYDHREIKFIRYDDGAGNFTVINDNGNASAEFLTFGNSYATNTGEIIKNNYLGDFYSIGSFVGQEYSNNISNGVVCLGNATSATVYNNTFSGNVNSNNFSGNVHSNNFSGNVNSNNFSGEVQSNIFSGDVYNNNFSGAVYNNTFSGNVRSNNFSGNVYNNTFSGDVNSNVFSGEVQNNIFSGIVYNNTFSGNVQSNNFSGMVIVTETQGFILNKIIPNVLNNNYKIELFTASTGDVYFRYFDGTNDITTLIP